MTPYRLSRIICSLLTLGAFATATAQINTDQMLRVGQNALYFNDYMVAIQYFNRITEAKPYLAAPYFYRSIAKLNLDDLDGAIADASKAIELNPFITDAYEVRGVAYQNKGLHALAVEDYDTALSHLPDNRNLLYNKAMALMEEPDLDRARETFTRLITAHPRYAGGYLARGRLRLMEKDTVAAIADIDEAVRLNPRSVNAYIMRSQINLGRDSIAAALADTEQALTLEPKVAGLYVNRSFMRYRLDDYYGAMADLDYALELDPLNTVALYNRALLRAEVHDTNRALDDLCRVIDLKGADYRSLYNRAILHKEVGDYTAALADVDSVLASFPDFAAAWFLRFDIEREKGDLRAAERDYKRSVALAKEKVNVMPLTDSAAADSIAESQEAVSKRFTSLLTVADNSRPGNQYNNPDIRGRVQDREISTETEPMMTLSYYSSPTELKQSTDFVREVDEINRMRALSHLLLVTNRVPKLDDEELINRHFESIRACDLYLRDHTPRAIDYLGRAMDHLTLLDYAAVIDDLDRALTLVPDFPLAYFLRSYAKAQSVHNPKPSRTDLMGAVADLNKAIEQSPSMAIAYYNRACLMLTLGDLTSALADLNKAIELQGDFGEAYYNRGYTYMRLGNKSAGVADLSRAGQLGIAPSYSLIKQINR